MLFHAERRRASTKMKIFSGFGNFGSLCDVEPAALRTKVLEVRWVNVDNDTPSIHVDVELMSKNVEELGSEDTLSHPGLYLWESTPQIEGSRPNFGNVESVTESE
jgi:hypothetical protein